MTTQKKKKSAKEKKVLIGSVVVAAAIVAGSTFAWFSSKDEVTNRLTASADYNVSIVEDFQPPKEWIPGQTVNKDVAAVNTGNVDAFVRMWLGGTLRLVSEAEPTVDASTNNAAAGLTLVNDENKTKLGLKYSKGNTYYKVLSTDKIENPNDVINANPESSDPMGNTDNNPAGFSEVQSVQAGGVLVYAPTDAHYTWNLEQATDMWTKGSTRPVLENLSKGTKVGTVGSTGITKEITPSQNDNSGNYYGAIDASTFMPQTTGLYLFRRTIDETENGVANKYEYSGYYYDSSLDKYFALHTADGANKHSDYVLPEGVINDNSTAATSLDQVLPVTIANGQKVYLYTATEVLKKTDDLTWTFNKNNSKFTVTYTQVSGKPVTIDIALANLGTDAEQWTAIEDNANSPSPQKTTFYYNNDLEAGDTTRKLVESVTLSPDTEVGAYLAFDFDLNVFMDSVQVTMTEDGKEGNDTVKNGWGTDVNALTGGNDTAAHPIMPAKGSIQTQSGSEIDQMKWENP